MTRARPLAAEPATTAPATEAAGAMAAGDQAPLVSAGLMLSRAGVYGLVWLDADLFVTARYGPLTDDIEVGAPVTESLAVLMGYEPEIAALPADGITSFELPAVAIVARNGDAIRRNISVFRSADRAGGFLMLFSRVVAASRLEVDLARQMRARLIAEGLVAQKSRELERANLELERCNRDLEDYAAVISHDLKSPLRGLRYIADEIEAAVAAARPEDARIACEKLRAQSLRMSRMLSQLLDYASLGRAPEVAETIDTHRLIGEIARSLPRPSGMVIEIDGQWPVIETFAAPLDLVLRNLLDNAVKHHDRDRGLVRLSCRLAGRDGIELEVADDGPGIERRHQDAVFLPFRSLNTAAESHSSGMGLAFVKRTVETVGGSLQIASDPPSVRGTTFSIGWPCRII